MRLEGARPHEAVQGAGQARHGTAHRGRFPGEGGTPAAQETQVGVLQPGGEVAVEDRLQILVETGAGVRVREQLMEAEEGTAGLGTLNAVDAAEDVVEHLAAGGVQGDDAFAQGAAEREDLGADAGEVPGNLLGQGDDLGQALGGLGPVDRDEVPGLGTSDLLVKGGALGAQGVQASRSGRVAVPSEAADLGGDGVQARPGNGGAGVIAMHQEADGGLRRGGQLVSLRPSAGRRSAHEHAVPAPLVAVGPGGARSIHPCRTQRGEVLIDELMELGHGPAAHLTA